jgi:transposase
MGWKQRTPEQWRRLVEGWERSELTQAQFCRKKGISVASLHRWKRLLADSPYTGSPSPAAPSAFMPVRLVERNDATAEVSLTVVLPDGVRIEVGAQCQTAKLREVLDVLRGAA